MKEQTPTVIDLLVSLGGADFHTNHKVDTIMTIH